MPHEYDEIYKCIDEMQKAIERQASENSYAHILFLYECEMFWRGQMFYHYSDLIFKSSLRGMTVAEAKYLEIHAPKEYPQPVASSVPPWIFEDNSEVGFS